MAATPKRSVYKCTITGALVPTRLRKHWTTLVHDIVAHAWFEASGLSLADRADPFQMSLVTPQDRAILEFNIRYAVQEINSGNLIFEFSYPTDDSPIDPTKYQLHVL